MALTITINQIIEIFRSVADRHLMVKDFGFGPTYNIGKPESINYPLLWLDLPNNYLELTERSTTGFYQVDLYCMDRIDKGQGNFDDTISDADYILNTVITEVTRGEWYRENLIKIEGTVQKELVVYDGNDNVNGWKATFILKFPIKYTECTVPIEEC